MQLDADGLASHDPDLAAPLFIRSGSAFEEAPDVIVIDSARHLMRQVEL